MYFYNILEPKFICDKAIKVLQQEQTRISIEIGKLKSENGIENYIKIQELSKLNYDYYKLIEQLKQLGDFGVQQMESIIKNKESKENCIF